LKQVNATTYLLDVNDVKFTSKKDTVIIPAVVAASDPSYQTGNEHIDGLVYKIQVSSEYLNVKIKKRQAKKIGEIESVMVDGIARYTLKEEFKTYNEVIEKVKLVRENLIADAFIIGIYNGKRC
jgi:hypothetical protein